jgi:protein translocase subunit secA
MAGRGTDIMLGGNPEFLAKQRMREMGYPDEIINAATGYASLTDPEVVKAREVYKEIYREEKEKCDREHDEVVALGGLHIIGSERHEARRIDNQLRGRSGRQGDPGSSRFYVSLEDDLMRLFGSEKVMSIMDALGVEEDMPLENNILTKQIESAQKRVESRNFDIRKRVLQFDDVMNKQREVIYGERKKVLDEENLRENIMSMVEAIVDESIEIYTGVSKYSEEWDYDGLFNHLNQYFLPKGSIIVENKEEVTKEGLKEAIMEIAEREYRKKEEEIGESNMRELERVVLLRTIDSKWMDHIDAMDDLRDGIGLRAYGQVDPVIEYQKEGYEMFQELIRNIQADTVRILYHISLQKEAPKREQVAKPIMDNSAPSEPVRNKGKKIGRNDPCPCGSGKKYKNCCGKNVKEAV